MHRPRCTLRCAALSLLGALLPLPLPLPCTRLAAQDAPPQYASPYLPAHHWAVEAARRLSLLGLTDRRFGWGDGSLTSAVVARALRGAIERAKRERPAYVSLAEGYWDRFAREFPASVARVETRPGSIFRWEGSALGGFEHATGRLLPVRSRDTSRANVDPPVPLPNVSEPGGDATLSAILGRYIAASVDPTRADGAWKLQEGYVMAAWKNAAIWGGRRAPGYGPGVSGGLAFNGTAGFTGGGFGFTEPFQLPSVLHYLGLFSFEGFLSQIDSNAAVKHPWVIALHGSWSPHPRLMFGLTQSWMFSGSGLSPFTWDNFLHLYLGHHGVVSGSEWDKGIVTAEIRFRPPVPVIPLVLYTEIGTEDTHDAWYKFPGMLVGAEVAALPGHPSISLGLEHTYFSGPCRTCDNCECWHYSTWYRHYVFKDGWTLDRSLIGNPLGGDGKEWLVYSRWDDPRSRLRLDANAFWRDRGDFNLFSPAHEGRSLGGTLGTTYVWSKQFDLTLTVQYEHGQTGWSDSNTLAGVQWYF